MGDSSELAVTHLHLTLSLNAGAPLLPSKRAKRGKCGLSGRFALLEAVTARRAVGRKAVLGERLLDAVIEHADFADAPCVAAARDLATEFA